MTPKEMEEYVQFMVWTLPLIMKEGDTHIKYFKGVDIPTYYIPTDPTKEKEPLLNKNLQKIWQKTVEQKRQLEKESITRAKNKLKQNPIEKEKARKNAKRDRQIVRLMKQPPVTFYSCNANHITNKMPTLAHATYAH